MNQQEAARAVLIEVVNILGAFKGDLVIVGGWVPDLLFPNHHHIGSLDVDLAVGPGAVGQDAYSSILSRLQASNYSHSDGPTRFYRHVDGAPEPVKVDLISGEYVNDDKARAIQVDELKLNCLRGIDLAFEVCEETVIKGSMPDGAQTVVRARVVSPEAFILIKAFALAERDKPKDAYDIAFILANYQPSIAALAAKMAELVADGLGAEAYRTLTEKFATAGSVGPARVAEMTVGTGDDSEQAKQAAYQNAQELFREIQQAQSKL